MTRIPANIWFWLSTGPELNVCWDTCAILYIAQQRTFLGWGEGKTCYYGSPAPIIGQGKISRLIKQMKWQTWIQKVPTAQHLVGLIVICIRCGHEITITWYKRFPCEILPRLQSVTLVTRLHEVTWSQNQITCDSRLTGVIRTSSPASFFRIKGWNFLC